MPEVRPRRPLRRDAEHNRLRMLTAAEQVFAEQGLDVSVDCLIEAAGVGTGTFYRRFPDKQALIDALVTELLATMTELARTALAEDRDGTGLERFLRAAGREMQTHSGFLARAWQHRSPPEQVAVVRQLVSELLVTAQRAGRAARTVSPTDISMVLWAVTGIIENTATVDPGAWERHLDLVLAGLRAGEPTYSRPPMSPEQLSSIAGRLPDGSAPGP